MSYSLEKSTWRRLLAVAVSLTMILALLGGDRPCRCQAGTSGPEARTAW